MSRPDRPWSFAAALSALVAVLAIPVTSSGQPVTIDFSAGPTGLLGPTYTDPGTGLQASGMWCNGDESTCTSASGVWTPAKLWRSDSINGLDLGLGVCDPAEDQLCTTGTVGHDPGEFNELSDRAGPEVIYLTLPAGYRWVSVTLSSLDDNSTDGGGPPESGALWADVDTTPNNGNAVFVTTYTGTTNGVPFLIDIPNGFESSPYLFLEPFDVSGAGSTNNDHLIYEVTLTNAGSTTTTIPTSSTTTTLPTTQCCVQSSPLGAFDSCVVSSAAQCVSANGIDVGGGTCTPNPCPPTTLSTTTTTTTLPTATTTTTTTATAPTTTSTTTTLPLPAIQCCVRSSALGAFDSCVLATAPQCASANGIAVGSGTCSPNPCPPTTTTLPPATTTTTTPPQTTTTTTTASPRTTTTVPRQAECSPSTCDDGDACTVDICIPGTGCVHDPINSPDDLGRELSACLGQTVPSSVGERFARGCELMREAAGQTPRKAKRFLNKAARAFKRAGRLAASAATRKKGSISPDCAADLRSILSGARDQARRLRTGG